MNSMQMFEEGYAEVQRLTDLQIVEFFDLRTTKDALFAFGITVLQVRHQASNCCFCICDHLCLGRLFCC